MALRAAEFHEDAERVQRRINDLGRVFNGADDGAGERIFDDARLALARHEKAVAAQRDELRSAEVG